MPTPITLYGLALTTPVTIRSNQPAFVSDTLSLRRRVASQGVQRWELEFSLAPSTNYGDYMAALVANNYTVTTTMPMPQVVSQPTTSTAITGSGTQYSTSVTLSSNPGIANGRYISFTQTGHTKVYVVTGAAGSTLTVYPPLLQTVPAGTTVNYLDTTVNMTAILGTENNLSVSYSDGILMDTGRISVVEAI